MFGFAPFARVPFAALPNVGIPALAELTGIQMEAFLNAPIVVGVGDVLLIAQGPLGTFTGTLTTDSAYRITGQGLQAYIANLAVSGTGTTTLDSQYIQSETGLIRTGISVYVFSQVLNSVTGSLEVNAKANVLLTGAEFAPLVNSVAIQAKAPTTITGQAIQDL